MWAEHERVLDERDRLAEEMEHMADPIAQIAHLVRQIEACDPRSGGSTKHRRRSSAIFPSCCRELRPNSSPVSGRLGLGRVYCGRGTAGPAGCFRWGKHEGQSARQAICGALAEVERGANSQQSSGDVQNLMVATRAAGWQTAADDPLRTAGIDVLRTSLVASWTARWAERGRPSRAVTRELPRGARAPSRQLHDGHSCRSKARYTSEFHDSYENTGRDFGRACQTA